MTRKRSIPETFFFNMVLVSALSTMVAGALIVIQEYQRFDRAAALMRVNYLEDRKAELQFEVDEAVSFIEGRRRDAEEDARARLREHVQWACATAGRLYEAYEAELDAPAVERLVLEALRGAWVGAESGDYVALGMDGVVRLSPAHPEWEGRRWDAPGDVADALGSLILQGVGSEPPPAMGDVGQGEDESTASFAMHFAALDWVVGGQIDLADVERKLQAEALAWLEQKSVGEGNYIFAGQWDGMSLSGPAVGQNMLGVTDPNGVKIVQSLIEKAKAGGGFVTYVMPKIEGRRPEPKISYANGVKAWGWYIGTGVYVDDIHLAVAAFRAARFSEMMWNAGKILLLLIGLCLGSFYFARRVALRTRGALDELSTFFQDVASGAPSPSAVGLGFAEFDELAAAANRMVDRRREAEQALRQSEARFRLLFAQAADAIYVSDLDGRLEQVNERACIATGYSEKELLGMNVSDLDAIHAEPESVQDFFSVLARERSTTLLSQHRRKDGSTFPVEIRIALLETAEGSHVFGIARDITERLHLESRLRQAQKMEAIGQLTGGVAHDFNNLLQVINGGAELALGDIGPDHKARTTLLEVAQAGENAASLVRQLLAFGRRQIMCPTPLDLDESITESLRLIRRLIGEHIQLEWKPGAAQTLVNADRGMLEQTIMNLCVNARDAMPEGGVLELRTARVEVGAEMLTGHGSAKPGPYAVVSVRDSGCGMNPDTLEHAFEPFFSTKVEGKGTGLGLATVYGIMEQHHGMVVAESEPGRGATVCLYWPLCEVAKSLAPESAALTAAGGSETLLLAEDDDLVGRMTATILETAGYTVLRAENGLEAVALFEEHGGAIDLTILDVVMPKMGGREAYDLIRSMQPDAKVLFASGYSVSAIDKNRVLESEFSLLQKPYTRVQLLRAVRAMLDGQDPALAP